MTEAPQWALDEAAKRSNFKDWEDAIVNWGALSTVTATIEAHALTIAKHEQQPVDPDLLLAKEVVREWRDSRLFDCESLALIAIRKVREMGK